MHTTVPSTARLLLFVLVTVTLGSGCGIFRRQSSTTSVMVNDEGKELAPLARSEYEVIGSSEGKDRSTQLYLAMLLPVGSQTTTSEGVDNAYYDAVANTEGCDALIGTRAETKRIVIPLLLLNIVVRKNRVQGRCIHVLEQVPPNDSTEDDRIVASEPLSGAAP